MAKKEYQRLTRARSRGFFAVAMRSRISLWLGADHLLFVDSSGYTENYKRFYCRDIQALTIQGTTMARTMNIVFALLLVLFVAFSLLAPNMGLRVFCFIIAAIWGICLLVNWVKGPSCRAYLRTAVQTEELYSLRRRRQAQKVFARLRPLIAAAQGGELTPEMVAAHLQEPPPPLPANPVSGAAESILPPRSDS